MRFDNHYINRYRSLPAASYSDEAPGRASSFPEADGYAVTVSMHYHPEAELIYVKRGEWYYRTADHGEYREARAGDIILFPPYEPHGAAMRSGGGYATECICFDRSILSALPGKEGRSMAERLSSGKPPLPIHIRSGERENGALYRSFEDMIRALDAPEHCEELLFIGSLCVLLGKIAALGEMCDFDAPDAEKKPADEAQRRFARAVIDYTEAYFGEPISARDAAGAMNYSEGYFCRTFRRVFRMSYGEYLRQRRITEACRLLGEGLPVTKAAERSGFSHMSLFSKVFREYVGITPTEYRNRIRAAERESASKQP